MVDPAASAAHSTTTDVRTSNTDTGTSTRSHRPRQSFQGQNHTQWQMVITSDKLRASTYNKLYKKTVGIVPSVCAGNLKHVLTALSTGKDYKFTEPSLDSTDKKSQLIFKIKYAEYCTHESNYQNNKIALAASLLS